MPHCVVHAQRRLEPLRLKLDRSTFYTTPPRAPKYLASRSLKLVLDLAGFVS